MTANEPADLAPLECRDLVKRFQEGNAVLEVLTGINLTVSKGETLAIIGASGSGKTTLLQLLGGLDHPTSGSVRISGEDISTLSNSECGFLRNRALGFVYQFHHLLPEFNAVENVAMPLLLRRMSMKEVRQRSVELLEKVGLGERLTHRPGELSGGERQRVAVARALVTRPAVVLADEPTGNLDYRTGQLILDLLLQLNAETGASLVIVTHDSGIARQMSKIAQLDEGALSEVSPSAL
jgi:lipoprotein-releasing system ATP-binding protein